MAQAKNRVCFRRALFIAPISSPPCLLSDKKTLVRTDFIAAARDRVR